MASIDKVNPITMTEDETKRSLSRKKFVTEWNNNQRTSVIRHYNGVAHKLVEVDEISGIEYEDEEITEYLNQS